MAREIGASRLLELHALAAGQIEKKVTITDLLLWALGGVLAGTDRESSVGLAVATDRGVLIPVLRSVAELRLSALAATRRASVERAVPGALADDSAPAIVTLSNLGMKGVSWFTGIIPIGQQALLTTGEITERAVVMSGKMVLAPHFTAVLIADHRAFDGLEAAQLLGDFAQRLESISEEVLS